MKIILTQGEVAGVAPEITEKLENHKELLKYDIYILRGKNTPFKLKTIKTIYIEDILDNKLDSLGLNEQQKIQFDKLKQGLYKFLANPLNENHYTILSIYFAAILTYIGLFDALVTNPVDKNIISRYVSSFRGHTGFLREMFSVPKTLMIMDCQKLPPIAILTEHISLKSVSSSITKESIISAIKLFQKSLNIKLPINIASLNPHAGDAGLISDEESKVIEPAIKILQKEGINVLGPIPADSLFIHKNLISVGGILTMYHDQGMLIPKTICFDSLVNITLGLPIVRTSPGHGVAFDIVGKGLASEKPLLNAIISAAKLATKSVLK